MNEIHWSQQLAYPALALMQCLPLLAIALISLLRRDNWIVAVSVLVASAELLLAIDLYRNFDHHTTAFQFAERVSFAGPLSYHVAIDGMGLMFLLLTTLLSLIVVIYGPIRGLRPYSRFMMSSLALEAALIGLFSTVDLLWFNLLSIVQMVLVGYMLYRWSTSPERELALKRYMQFMATGALLLLLGTFMLGWHYAETHQSYWTFNLFELQQAPLASALQTSVFFLLFYGLAIRIPLFPLHGWLPLAITHGSVAVSPVFLIGVKTGVYGLLRFAFALTPQAIVYWAPYVVAFAVAGVFYAALLAMMQNNLRRMLAYAVVSHTGILIIGLFSLNALAFQGGIMLAANFGIAISVLLFMTGMVYRRTRTTSLPKLGGLFDQIPLIGVGFLAGGLAIIGMPGTPGFDAVHLVLEASIEHYGALLTIAAALGNVLAAGFLLRAFQRAFLSPRDEDAPPQYIQPTHAGEKLITGSLVALIVLIGFFGEPWFDMLEGTVERMQAQYEPLTEQHGARP